MPSAFPCAWFFFLLYYLSHCSIHFWSLIISWWIPHCQSGCVIIFWYPHSIEILAYDRYPITIGRINILGYRKMDIFSILIFFCVSQLAENHYGFNPWNIQYSINVNWALVSQMKMSSWIIASKQTSLCWNEATGWAGILVLLGLDLTTDCATWSRSQNSLGPDLLVCGMKRLFIEYNGMTDFKNILIKNYYHVNIISFFKKFWIIRSRP